MNIAAEVLREQPGGSMPAQQVAALLHRGWPAKRVERRVLAGEASGFRIVSDRRDDLVLLQRFRFAERDDERDRGDRDRDDRPQAR